MVLEVQRVLQQPTFFTLDCYGDSNAAFDLFAVGGSGNLEISSLTPGTVLPANWFCCKPFKPPTGTYVFEVTDLSPPSILTETHLLLDLLLYVLKNQNNSMVLERFDPACPEDIALETFEFV